MVADHSFQNASSFRDPTGSVVVHDNHVERSCATAEIPHIRSLIGSEFFNSLVEEKLICDTRFDETTQRVWQERIINWSYPSEWCFSMLRDAALLSLELQRRALASGYSLKDASAFNITFRGSAPLFVDVYSFEILKPALSWVAYDQFCREFLNPLLIHSITGIPISSLLRGRTAGITSTETVQLLSWRAVFRRSMLLHLYLKQKLDRRYSAPGEHAPLMESKSQPAPELCLEVQRKLILGLESAIRRLKPNYSSPWESYTQQNSYALKEREKKIDFISRLVSQNPNQSWIDYGCNTGEYSRMIRQHAKLVISVDSDEACIEKLYTGRLKTDDDVIPLVLDINNPTPGCGWEGKERISFHERFHTDCFLALALVHHLRFGNNVPVPLIAQFFSRHERGIIEYVAFDDPMVRHLTRHRNREDYWDYEFETFKGFLANNFVIEEEFPVSDTRCLLVVRRSR